MKFTACSVYQVVSWFWSACVDLGDNDSVAFEHDGRSG